MHLFHGTSLVQYERLREARFKADGLYLGEDRVNIADHYAEQQAERDESWPVIVTVDATALCGLEPDSHARSGGIQVRQDGQFLYSGPLESALVSAVAYDFLNDRTVSLPLDRASECPLPLSAGLANCPTRH